jgi:hypothetical protein
VVLAALAGMWMGGAHHQAIVDQVTQQNSVAKATTTARDTEHARQGAINAALQKQFDDLQGINSGLVSDIASLRNRPPRRSVSANTTIDCKGSTGRELSEPDAVFLTRLASRADTLRASLKACYRYADTLSTQK